MCASPVLSTPRHLSPNSQPETHRSSDGENLPPFAKGNHFSTIGSDDGTSVHKPDETEVVSTSARPYFGDYDHPPQDTETRLGRQLPRQRSLAQYAKRGSWDGRLKLHGLPSQIAGADPPYGSEPALLQHRSDLSSCASIARTKNRLHADTSRQYAAASTMASSITPLPEIGHNATGRVHPSTRISSRHVPGRIERKKPVREVMAPRLPRRAQDSRTPRSTKRLRKCRTWCGAKLRLPSP